MAEGTVGRWLKKVGDSFEADEAIVEIETDKVTAELPAPSAGTLVEIVAEEGADVEVGAVVGRITTGAGAPAKNRPSPPKTKPKPKRPRRLPNPAGQRIPVCRWPRRCANWLRKTA